MMRDFNHPDACWKSSKSGYKQYRRLLECIQNNFLVQALDKASRGLALLDLVLTSVEDLIKVVKTGGSLGCIDHTLVDFMKNMILVKSNVSNVKF